MLWGGSGTGFGDEDWIPAEDAGMTVWARRGSFGVVLGALEEGWIPAGDAGMTEARRGALGRVRDGFRGGGLDSGWGRRNDGLGAAGRFLDEVETRQDAAWTGRARVDSGACAGGYGQGDVVRPERVPDDESWAGVKGEAGGERGALGKRVAGLTRIVYTF